jgi:hypothetical protein
MKIRLISTQDLVKATKETVVRFPLLSILLLLGAANHLYMVIFEKASLKYYSRNLRTSRKKLRRTILELRLWLKKYNSKRLKWIMGMVKAKLRGLYNYFGVAGNESESQRNIDLYRKTLYLLLNRRSQRKSFNNNQFSFILRFHGVVPYRSRIINEGTQLSLLLS